MEPEERILRVAGEALVQLLVILIRQLAFGTAPEGAGGIYLLGGASLVGLLGFGVPLTLVIGQEDGEGDVVGVLLDDLAQTPAVGILLAFVVEVNDDSGASHGAFGGLDAEAGLAVAAPPPRSFFTRLARDHLHVIGHHENGVKAHTELADEVGILLRIARELREKVLGAGTRDGAQVRDEIVLVHADAGVGDREPVVALVQLQVDARVKRQRLVDLIRQGQMTQLVERVRAVGDELAKKDLRMGIERVNDELQQLRDFSLKFKLRHDVSLCDSTHKYISASARCRVSQGLSAPLFLQPLFVRLRP